MGESSPHQVVGDVVPGLQETRVTTGEGTSTHVEEGFNCMHGKDYNSQIPWVAELQ